MKEQAWNYIDKTTWPDGPWKSEPDKMQWVDEATDLDCLIVRVPHSGHLCGYVGVSEGHPAFQQSYEHIDVDVHGGLTFSDACSEHKDVGGICRIPLPGRPEHVWWLGFDCAHGGDLSPAYDRRGGNDYRPVSYVQSQCAQLAQQLLAKLEATQAEN